MFILSQVFAGLVLICFIVQYQLKGKIKIMIVFTIANIFYTLSCVCLADWVGTGINGIAVLRNIAFLPLILWRDKIPKWLSVLLLLFFMVTAVVVVSILWVIWWNWVVLGMQLFLIYGCWHKSAHRMRIANCFWAAAFIVHCVLMQNWLAIAVEGSVLISVSVFYIRQWISYRRRKLFIQCG